MIDKWTILNLPCREDRRFISIAGAHRLGVPIEKVRFWHGYAIEDFENFDHVLEALASDMPELAEIHKNTEIHPKEHSKLLMLWNYSRYLRWLSQQEGRVEAIVHDGLQFSQFFRPSFEWFEGVVSEIKDYDPNFKLLTFGLHNAWYDQMININPITPSSLIGHGILSWDNFGRIVSDIGAKWMLERIMSQTQSVRCNSILLRRKNEVDGWDTGCYSTILPLGSDYSPKWLGSNSFPHLSGIQDEYAKLFGTEDREHKSLLQSGKR